MGNKYELNKSKLLRETQAFIALLRKHPELHEQIRKILKGEKRLENARSL